MSPLIVLIVIAAVVALFILRSGENLRFETSVDPHRVVMAAVGIVGGQAALADDGLGRPRRQLPVPQGAQRPDRADPLAVRSDSRDRLHPARRQARVARRQHRLRHGGDDGRAGHLQTGSAGRAPSVSFGGKFRCWRGRSVEGRRPRSREAAAAGRPRRSSRVLSPAGTQSPCGARPGEIGRDGYEDATATRSGCST